MPTYKFNIAKNGQHYCAIGRSGNGIELAEDARDMWEDLNKRFPTSEGFEITLQRFTTGGLHFTAVSDLCSSQRIAMPDEAGREFRVFWYDAKGLRKQSGAIEGISLARQFAHDLLREAYGGASAEAQKLYSTICDYAGNTGEFTLNDGNMFAIKELFMKKI